MDDPLQRMECQSPFLSEIRVETGIDSSYRSCPDRSQRSGESPQRNLLAPVRADHVDQVCGRCRSWVSCCFCGAEPEQMRTALRRIAELHSGCDQRCPEVERLAGARKSPRCTCPFPGDHQR